jgi:hypothetical protein
MTIWTVQLLARNIIGITKNREKEEKDASKKPS